MNDIMRNIKDLKQQVPYYAENFVEKTYMTFGDKKTSESITVACINKLAALNELQILDDEIEDNIINHIYNNSIFYKSAEKVARGMMRNE